MPTDSKGKFHLSAQRALSADKPPRPPVATGAGAGAEHQPQGFANEGHEHIHNALREAHARAGGGKHMHIGHFGAGAGFETHHTDEQGEPQGPHDHDNLEALKDALGNYFNEEQSESAYGGAPPPPRGAA